MLNPIINNNQNRRQSVDYQTILNKYIYELNLQQDAEKILQKIGEAMEWFLNYIQKPQDYQKQINWEQNFFLPLYHSVKKQKINSPEQDFSVIKLLSEKIYERFKNTNESSMAKNWNEKIQQIIQQDILKQSIIIIIETSDKKICFEMFQDQKLKQLKKKIEEVFLISSEQQSLIYAGQDLIDDEKTIKELYITDQCTLKLSIQQFNLQRQNVIQKNISNNNSANKNQQLSNDSDLYLKQQDIMMKMKANEQKLTQALKRIEKLQTENKQKQQTIDDLRRQLSELSKNQLKATTLQQQLNDNGSESSENFGIDVDDSLITNEEEKMFRPLVFGKDDLKECGKLGAGGFGSIFKVQWVGNDYAAKVFKIKGDQGAFNFLYETSMYTQLMSQQGECDNIIKLEGIQLNFMGNDSFDAIIVMELCSNGDIDTIIKSKSKYTNKQKLDWCREIAQGIMFLHKNNVVHNDLKPANILLDKDLKAKIVDFGISKQVDSTKMTYKIGVSVRYSPYEQLLEQIEGETIMSKKSDIWMFGGVMFYIFYEVQPWEGKNHVEITKLMKDRQHIFQNTVIDEQKKQKVPEEIYNLLTNKIFNHDYQKRPDIEEVLKDLIAIQVQE